MLQEQLTEAMFDQVKPDVLMTDRQAVIIHLCIQDQELLLLLNITGQDQALTVKADIPDPLQAAETPIQGLLQAAGVLHIQDLLLQEAVRIIVLPVPQEVVLADQAAQEADHIVRLQEVQGHIQPLQEVREAAVTAVLQAAHGAAAIAVLQAVLPEVAVLAAVARAQEVAEEDK